MIIRNIKNILVGDLYHEIYQAIYNSRFKADLSIVRNGIKIVNVLLYTKKPYCGNHGGPCVRPHTGPHRKHYYLEGADWVEFNDLLNDVCDRLSVSCSISSSVVSLRRGTERCVWYNLSRGPGTEWNRLGIYEDWCGKQAPNSKFPDGTPGIYKDHYFCEG